MFATVTLTLALVATPYPDESLHAFVALSSGRVIDGVSQADGPVLGTGLAYSDDNGLFASSSLSHFNGHEGYWPDQTVSLLESSAGFQWRAAEASLSIAGLDYRHLANYRDAESSLAHHGLVLALEIRGWRAEIGVETDVPYYYASARRFVEYDQRRLALSWSKRLESGVEPYFGSGIQDIAGYDALRFASAGIRWQWQGLEWQLGISHAHANRFPLPMSSQGAHVILRVARSFQLVPSAR